MRKEESVNETYGGMRDTSVLEMPLFNVVSRRVQPSPLLPQPPEKIDCKYEQVACGAWRPLTGLEVTGFTA